MSIAVNTPQLDDYQYNGSYRLRVFADFLFKVIVFFCVFDGIRSAMLILSNQLTLVKEVALALLMVVYILKNKKIKLKKYHLYFSNIPFVLYLVIIGTILITVNNFSILHIVNVQAHDKMPGNYAMHFKNIEAFLIIFLLLNYELLTGKSINLLLAYFVRLSVIYVLFTIVVYFFVDLSFIFAKLWYGRISIGYSTADTQVLCVALGYLVFIKQQLSVFVKAFYVVVLIIGILMNATSTGFTCLFLIAILYVIYLVFSKKLFKVFKLRLRNVFIIVGIFITSGLISVFLDKNSADLDFFYNIFSIKITSVTSKVTNLFYKSDNTEEVDDFGSKEVREDEITQAFSVKNGAIDMAIGGPIELGSLIENQNYFLIRSYGYIGFTFYYAWFVYLLLYALNNMRNQYGRLLFITCAMFFLSNFALLTAYMYTVSVSFALIVAFCVGQIKLMYMYRDGEKHNSIPQLN